ncbi:pyridoxal-phosphate dependent enzyme [Fulvivirgaceae bacterium BMA10]|uniref:Pyridoxal-phosphate dependent enzyme n=1 Tax=Splendidivirga corallicola TaxID=3051826 RepID=A0ABT8KWR2_9BACT|nr:pyridoxal-phosphate dependent enzyme [Fulvivirgaceae bacterium BMA10]
MTGISDRIPLQRIYESAFDEKKIQLFIKREDMIHPVISGNKWRKLKYNLVEAKKKGFKKLLTFGGAYSNHILSVAGAGKEYGFETIGIIRGEESLPLNPTLKTSSQKFGMQLHYVSRSKYKDKNDSSFIESLRAQFGDFYLLPEGGTNVLAIKGCIEIVEDIDMDFDYICSSCGTGGTLSGIIIGLKGSKKALGFSALKGDFLEKDISQFIHDYHGINYNNWSVNSDFHFGGYAKVKPELISFINDFKERHGIPLDPIYTGKMLFGIYDLVDKGYFENESKIIAIHTGGLQGIEGFNERYGGVIQ